jgi:hypothetical protein
MVLVLNKLNTLPELSVKVTSKLQPEPESLDTSIDFTKATFAVGVVYNVVLSVVVRSTFAFTKLFDINLKRSFERQLHPLVLVDTLCLIFVLYCQDPLPAHQQHLDDILY